MKINFDRVRNLKLSDFVEVPPGDDLRSGYTLVGKVRPWDESDDEYVVYIDGDLLLVSMEPNDNTSSIMVSFCPMCLYYTKETTDHVCKTE